MSKLNPSRYLDMAFMILARRRRLLAALVFMAKLGGELERIAFAWCFSTEWLNMATGWYTGVPNF